MKKGLAYDRLIEMLAKGQGATLATADGKREFNVRGNGARYYYFISADTSLGGGKGHHIRYGNGWTADAVTKCKEFFYEETELSIEKFGKIEAPMAQAEKENIMKKAAKSKSAKGQRKARKHIPTGKGKAVRASSVLGQILKLCLRGNRKLESIASEVKLKPTRVQNNINFVLRVRYGIEPHWSDTGVVSVTLPKGFTEETIFSVPKAKQPKAAKAAPKAKKPAKTKASKPKTAAKKPKATKAPKAQPVPQEEAPAEQPQAEEAPREEGAAEPAAVEG